VWILNELEKMCADKKVMVYANRYDYVDYVWKYNQEIDKFNYWIAQYPWRNWVNWFTDYFKQWWTDLFNMQKAPNLPASRPPNGWELWQIVASSGVGNELGFYSDELDFNVSRRPKDEFFAWLGLPDRLAPPPVIDDARLLKLEEDVAVCNQSLALLAAIVSNLQDDQHTHGEEPPPLPDGTKKIVIANGGAKEWAPLSFSKGLNEAGRPKFEIYPGDSRPASERVFVANGTPITVELTVTKGDGARHAYKIIEQPKIMTNRGVGVYPDAEMYIEIKYL